MDNDQFSDQVIKHYVTSTLQIKFVSKIQQHTPIHVVTFNQFYFLRLLSCDNTINQTCLKPKYTNQLSR